MKRRVERENSWCTEAPMRSGGPTKLCGRNQGARPLGYREIGLSARIKEFTFQSSHPGGVDMAL